MSTACVVAVMVSSSWTQNADPPAFVHGLATAGAPAHAGGIIGFVLPTVGGIVHLAGQLAEAPIGFVLPNHGLRAPIGFVLPNALGPWRAALRTSRGARVLRAIEYIQLSA